MQLIYLVLTGCCLVAALEDVEVEQAWLNFKQKFNKSFSHDGLMENQNFLKFQENLEMISEHNDRYKNGEVSFEMGINQFSDMDIEDVEAFSMGLNPNDPIDSLSNSNTFMASLTEDIPDSMNWRTKGAVTPVKNQGHCGSCWAFAAVGAMESQYFMKNQKLIRLSEQNLVDCSRKNSGCHGGRAMAAFDHIRKKGGINYETDYPYKGTQKRCRFHKKHVAAKCNGYTRIAKGNENDLKVAVATQGPFAVSIKATKYFKNYKSGVLNDNRCGGGHTNHAVLVVGYGSENGQDYWLVKNSWGTQWGDQGYIKMARNKNNQCSIALRAVTPKIV